MPEWEALVTIISLTLVIIVTVVGNILVIISVFTHNPLKITPNYFIVSLAMADLTVSVIVLPINIVYTVLGRWVSLLFLIFIFYYYCLINCTFIRFLGRRSAKCG